MIYIEDDFLEKELLETILLGKILDINPFDQPAVELIKVNTKKILKKN